MMISLVCVLCLIGFAVEAFPFCSELRKTHYSTLQRVWSLRPIDSTAESFTSFMLPRDDLIWKSPVNDVHGFGHNVKIMVAEDLPLNLTSAHIRSLPPSVRFKYRVRQLMEYKMRHGNYTVPVNDASGLDKWIRTQRYEYRLRMQGKDSLLTADRIDLLNRIGFDWQLEAQDGRRTSWMKSYNELKEYYEKHGHSRLRASDGTLGKWMANQRYMYKRLQQGQTPTSMTDKRIELLEALDMVWDNRAEGQTKYDAKWQERYEELAQFQKEHGHCFVASNSGSLGRWVSNQRKAYQNRLKYNVSSLTDKREKLLRDIGFDFDVDGSAAWQNTLWEASYKELEQYYQKHGHTIVKTGTSPLGNWVNWQRQEYRRLKEGLPSSMTPERIEALEKLDFVWRVEEKSRKRMQKYARLKDIYNEYGGADVPSSVLLDSEMGPWIKKQRTLLKQAEIGEETTLTEEQIRLLEEMKIGEVLHVKTRAPWEDRLKELIDFQSKFGHTRVTPSHDVSLSRWVKRQRLQYHQWREGKRSPMTVERMERLESLGFEWSVPIGRPKVDRPKKEPKVRKKTDAAKKSVPRSSGGRPKKQKTR